MFLVKVVKQRIKASTDLIAETAFLSTISIRICNLLPNYSFYRLKYLHDQVDGYLEFYLQETLQNMVHEIKIIFANSYVNSTVT